MPLIESVIGGNSLDILRCLVRDLGADVNGAMLDANGATALIIAAQLDNLVVIRFLVKKLGANVNQLQATVAGAMPLYIAAENGNLTVARCLVEELGAEVKKIMHDGHTALYIASAKGHLRLVQYLASEGSRRRHQQNEAQRNEFIVRHSPRGESCCGTVHG
jgi:ankyrin repeat protein